MEEMITGNNGEIRGLRVKVRVLSKREKTLYLTGLTVLNL